MTRTQFIVLIIVLFILGAYFARTEISELFTAGPAVATSTIASETDTYKIRADYPVFGISDIDATIRGAVEAGVASFEKEPANPSPNDIKNEFVTTFDSVYDGKDYASVRLILYQYTGGAHGISVAAGVTYDRAKGELLTLDDALVLIGTTLPELSEIALQQLTERLGEDGLWPEGVAPSPENFAVFTVNEDAVVFTFQHYQVAPYASGMPQVVVPRVQ